MTPNFKYTLEPSVGDDNCLLVTESRPRVCEPSGKARHSYVVTVIGLPMAIAVFIYEQRRERQNEEEEIFQRLSDEYREFLKLVLDNADLHLLRRAGERDLDKRGTFLRDN